MSRRKELRPFTLDEALAGLPPASTCPPRGPACAGQRWEFSARGQPWAEVTLKDYSPWHTEGLYLIPAMFLTEVFETTNRQGTFRQGGVWDRMGTRWRRIDPPTVQSNVDR